MKAKNIKIGGYYVNEGKIIKIIKLNYPYIGDGYLDQNNNIWWLHVDSGYSYDGITFLHKLTKKQLKKYWPIIIKGDKV